METIRRFVLQLERRALNGKVTVLVASSSEVSQ
jgi:hypothetical protein